MAGIELSDVAAAEILHEAGDRTDPWRCNQQMNVVVHQHTGVQLAARGWQCLTENGQITSSVGIVEKQRRRLLPRWTTCCGIPDRSSRGCLAIA